MTTPADVPHLSQPTVNTPPLEITGSPEIIDWLANLSLSLAFTTYQTCRLFLVGIKPDGRLSAFKRSEAIAQRLPWRIVERLWL